MVFFIDVFDSLSLVIFFLRSVFSIDCSRFRVIINEIVFAYRLNLRRVPLFFGYYSFVFSVSCRFLISSRSDPIVGLRGYHLLVLENAGALNNVFLFISVIFVTVTLTTGNFVRTIFFMKIKQSNNGRTLTYNGLQ